MTLKSYLFLLTINNKSATTIAYSIFTKLKAQWQHTIPSIAIQSFSWNPAFSITARGVRSLSWTARGAGSLPLRIARGGVSPGATLSAGGHLAAPVSSDEFQRFEVGPVERYIASELSDEGAQWQRRAGAASLASPAGHQARYWVSESAVSGPSSEATAGGKYGDLWKRLLVGDALSTRELAAALIGYWIQWRCQLH